MKFFFGLNCCCILFLGVALTACQSTEPTSSIRVIQPGAPGESSSVVDADNVGNDVASYTDADVHFMTGMIGHHAQALDMTALIEGRTERRDLRLLGMRISASQMDEIRLMQNWLKRKGEEVPDATAHHMLHGHAGMMPGMLNMDQMRQLEEASGNEFYRLFLEFMIMHHEGALTMVQELLASEGAAQDSEVFRLATDVDVDQRMEITRMATMLQDIR